MTTRPAWRALQNLLSAEGFNVVTARDGQLALAEFQREKEVRKGWWDPQVFAEFECLIEKVVQKFISVVKPPRAAASRSTASPCHTLPRDSPFAIALIDRCECNRL